MFGNTLYMLQDGVIAQVVTPRPVEDGEPRITAHRATDADRAPVHAPSRRATPLLRRLRSANA
jgi:hypothetical protein